MMLTKENQLGVFVTTYDLSSDLLLPPNSYVTLNNLQNSQLKFLLDFKIIVPHSQNC